MRLLIQRAFEVQRAAAPMGCTVPPDMPILFFGNLAAYSASKLRVVTVAVNPSSAEFPAQNPLERFAAWRGHADQPLAPVAEGAYQAALSEYFETRPHWRWFSHLEPVLNGFRASYKAGMENRALHTDLLSPVATSPKWGKLRQDTRAALVEAGIPLWHDLVGALKPHLVLMSFGPRHKSEITFEPRTGWDVVLRLPQPRGNYCIEHQTIDLPHQQPHPAGVDLLFGPLFKQPFGGLTNDAKRLIGPSLYGRLTNW